MSETLSGNKIKSQFDNVKLEDDSVSDGSTADVEEGDNAGTEQKRRKKLRKKKVYFRSDFVNDESSSSDDDAEDKVRKRFWIQEANPADLTWTMWLWYYLVFVSVGAFHAAEYCGEKLADLFGITAPKYQYAINEYHRLRQEEQEEEEAEQREQEFVRQQEINSLKQLETGEQQLEKEPT